jgi:hypothetical protein
MKRRCMPRTENSEFECGFTSEMPCYNLQRSTVEAAHKMVMGRR